MCVMGNLKSPICWLDYENSSLPSLILINLSPAYMKESFHFILRSPSSSMGLVLAYWSSCLKFKPRSRRNLLNCKRGSTAHSLLLSSTIHPDMTELLLKRTYNHKSSIHPSFILSKIILSETEKSYDVCLWKMNGLLPIYPIANAFKLKKFEAQSNSISLLFHIKFHDLCPLNVIM